MHPLNQKNTLEEMNQKFECLSGHTNFRARSKIRAPVPSSLSILYERDVKPKSPTWMKVRH